METFARVAEAKSFSAAAQRLNVSKSVVSKHITQLEQRLGVRLINRTTRSLSLTDIGEQFYARCAEIVAAAEEAERQAMHLQAAPRGVLKITAPVSFGMRHLAPALTQFLKVYPELHVDLSLTNRVVNLVEEGFDMSLLIEQQPTPNIVARPITTIHRYICASPAYLAEHGTPNTPEALKQHECILFTGTAHPRKWPVTGPNGQITISVNGRLCINNFNAIQAATLAGAGVALLPDHIAGEDLAAGRLVALLPEYSPSCSVLTAIYPANKHVASKVRVLIDFLVQRFGDREPHPWATRGAVEQAIRSPLSIANAVVLSSS